MSNVRKNISLLLAAALMFNCGCERVSDNSNTITTAMKQLNYQQYHLTLLLKQQRNSQKQLIRKYQ